jgi:hypothetical protein
MAASPIAAKHIEISTIKPPTPGESAYSPSNHKMIVCAMPMAASTKKQAPDNKRTPAFCRDIVKPIEQKQNRPNKPYQGKHGRVIILADHR